MQIYVLSRAFVALSSAVFFEFGFTIELLKKSQLQYWQKEQQTSWQMAAKPSSVHHYLKKIRYEL